MKFQSLVKLLEAKGTKPGDRYYRASQGGAQQGPSSSPIGKSNYNPELPTAPKRSLPTPTDKGFRDEKFILGVAKNTIRLLKTNPTFIKGLYAILQDFGHDIEKNSISKHNEMILTKYPTLIDQTWSTLHDKKVLLNKVRMDPHSVPYSEDELINGGSETRIVRIKDKKTGKERPVKMKVDPGINDLEAKYERLKQKYDEAQEAIEELVGENEASEEYFREKIQNFIRNSAKEVRDQLLDEYGEELTKASTEGSVTPIVVHSFEDLAEALKDRETEKEQDPVQDILNKISVLDKLIQSGEEGLNIIEQFLEQYANNYIEVKDYIYNKLPKGTENLNQLIIKVKENLPLLKLKDFLNRVRDDAPIRLPKVRSLSKAKQVTGITAILAGIDPSELLDKKEEIANAISELDIDENRKNAAIGILNNPRENPAKIIQKLKGMLGGISRDTYKAGATFTKLDDDTLTEETFNSVVCSILNEKKKFKMY